MNQLTYLNSIVVNAEGTREAIIRIGADHARIGHVANLAVLACNNTKNWTSIDVKFHK